MYYDASFSAAARASAMVAVVVERDRMRARLEDLPDGDTTGRRVLRDGIRDLEDALDSLHGATPTDHDRISEEAIQRTLAAIKKEARP